jgi:hypothetical protein
MKCRWPLGVVEDGALRLYNYVEHEYGADGQIRATCPNCLAVKSMPGIRGTGLSRG